jgi:N-acetylmuramoyl-L-alanine amidase
MKNIDESSLNTLREYIEETKGIIAVNNGRAVDLFYTKSCGGATANSEDISGIRINYLRKVICRNCSEVTEEKIIPVSEFAAKLKISTGSCRNELGNVFKDVVRDDSGRIISINFFGRNMTGEEFVKFFNISSNKVYFMEDSVILRTVGEGLGLGICIEGANKLAQRGYNFENIIRYYYTDIEIISIDSGNVSKPLVNKRFLIDAGHGGTDKGNEFNGLCEKDINLIISNKLRKRLVETGAEVLMTRDDDHEVALSERVKYINDSRPDFYISIHQNSFTVKSVNGVEIYSYYNDYEAIKLGEYIIKEIGDDTGIRKRGVRTGDYYLLRECKMSGIIIECMYMTGNIDYLRYNEDMYEKISNSIFEGICKYYNIGP